MKFWLKQLFITLLPFIYIGRELKKAGKSTRLSVLVTYVCFVIFVIFWYNIFSDKETNKILKSELSETRDYLYESSLELEEMQAENNTLKKDLKKANEYAKLTDKEKKLIKEEQDKKKYESWIEKQFSSLDGSNKQLKDMTINNLNDPDSFKHLETVYYKTNDMKSIMIKMKFTAKNGFGGTVTNIASFTLLRDNEKIENFEIN